VPGHSPASICLYHAPQKILIAGDALFKESIGRTDLPGGNHHQLIKNIKENNKITIFLLVSILVNCV